MDLRKFGCNKYFVLILKAINLIIVLLFVSDVRVANQNLWNNYYHLMCLHYVLEWAQVSSTFLLIDHYLVYLLKYPPSYLN
jgi:hypothetical protein